MAHVTPEPHDEWAIVELFGHIRHAGRITEVERFGVRFGRVDVPDTAPNAVLGALRATHEFAGAAVFRLTPCTEAAARLVAEETRPIPPHEWSNRLLPEAAESEGDDSATQPTDNPYSVFVCALCLPEEPAIKGLEELTIGGFTRECESCGTSTKHPRIKQYSAKHLALKLLAILNGNEEAERRG